MDRSLHLLCYIPVQTFPNYMDGCLRLQLQTKLSPRSIQRLSRRIVANKEFIPLEFARKMRPLTDLLYWKATEFRLFVVYCGIVFLKDIEVLSQARYSNFLNFSVAMRVLLISDASAEHVEITRQLLKDFVEGCQKEYGRRFISCNVHSCIHLLDDYKRFRCLDKVSYFPFESCLGLLKHSLQGRFEPLQQMARNAYHQNSNAIAVANVKSNKKDIKNCGVVPPHLVGAQQYSSIALHSGCVIRRDTVYDSFISSHGAVATKYKKMYGPPIFGSV